MKNLPQKKLRCYNAAEYGWLEVLKWARINGCPWDKHTCYWVAEARGHLEVVKWVRNYGCPDKK